VNGGLRCFVAIGLPESLRETVAAFFAREGRGVPGVRWAPGAHLHLTLKFLGEVAADRLAEVRAAVEAPLADHGPFAMELRGAGAFPSVQRPRVIWVGLGAGAAETMALAGALERSLAPLGFAPEQRAFTPHLTVGRVKAPGNDRAALPRLIAAVRDRVWGETVAREVHLMRSELFPAGPIYSILHATILPGTPPQDR
jgi:RNA 2',3'-cyclic 3'-phosphodiesterase